MSQRSLDAFLTTRPTNVEQVPRIHQRKHERDETAVFTSRRPRGEWMNSSSPEVYLPRCHLLYRSQRGCYPPPLIRPFAEVGEEHATFVVKQSFAFTPEIVSSNAVAGLVFDKQEDFCISLQKSCASLYAVSSWTEKTTQSSPTNAEDDADEPTVSLQFNVIRDRPRQAGSRSGGFSSLAFCGDTLFVTAAYTRLPFIDVFDLEEVDEAVADPAQQFDLSHIEGATASCGSQSHFASSTNNLAPYGTALCQVTCQVCVGALSDGRTVWMDRRKRQPHALFVSKNVNLTLGSSAARERASPLTAVAKVGDHMVMTGSMSGIIKLWDVRRPVDAVAEMSAGAEIGSICPVQNGGCDAYRCGARSSWVNTRNGQLLLITTGAEGMETVSFVNTNDTSRTTTNINMGTPKAVYCETMDIVLYPHYASNALLFCEGSVTPGCSWMENEPETESMASTVDADDEAPYHGDESDAVTEGIPHFTSALKLYEQPKNTSAPSTSPMGVTAEVKLRASLQFQSEFTVASCGAIEKLDAIVMGDAYGNIKLYKA